MSDRPILPGGYKTWLDYCLEASYRDIEVDAQLALARAELAELRAEVERLTAERDAAREGIAVATETAQRAIDEVKRLRANYRLPQGNPPKLPTPRVYANDGPTLDQRLDDAIKGEPK